jgi:hypothetical protein
MITLIPWSRVLEKLIIIQLVKKFPVFCGTQRFSIMFTGALSELKTVAVKCRI